ncbi:MAG: T9SS type A sorting domain-containing protein [Fulvivirga sp.]|nr:T9SS type A sorting domain-containing protein [Fulvivirga sp.]
MHHFARATIVFLAILSFLPGLTQNNIPIGTWRTHYSYHKLSHLLQVGDEIYASGERGLFIFNQEDNSITKVTKVDGLQGGMITAMAYNALANKIIIAYASGNIDLIKDREITNLDITANAQVQGSKKINHIVSFNQYAFISTDFGVLKFDVMEEEVTETYRELGLDGSNNPTSLKVNMATIYNDSLFIASDQGVLAANLVENINLLDFQIWKRFDAADGISQNKTDVIAAKNEQVVAGISMEGIYTYTAGEWSIWNGVLNDATFQDIYTGESNLLVADSAVFQFTEAMTISDVTPTQTAVLTAISESSGNIWIGSLNQGLLKTNEGMIIDQLIPSGPTTNTAFMLHYADDEIISLSGGFDSGVNPLGRNFGFNIFNGQTWVGYASNDRADVVLPEFADVTDAARSNGKLYISSAGYGLLEIGPENEMSIIDETNSPFVNLDPPNRRVIVPAIAGSQGLWGLNFGINQIHFLNQEGIWSSLTISSGLSAFANDLIVVDDKLWLIINPVNGGGIVVADSRSGESRYLSSSSGNGGLASTVVHTLALDLEGFVWAGTDRGVSVFTNPDAVLTGNVEAIEPIFDSQQLLRDETVTVIKVDGANRKWMGTKRGVWLFDEEADRQIRFFDESNSPLPSGEILDIAIHEKTGEVFFATNAGIVSWRGTATSSTEKHEEVAIFPNPVTANFTGTVGISGLAANANVKITDVSGKLIWQTFANGGTATWQVRDYNGNRAAPGIYLIFSSSADGEETFVGKIAVVE